MVKLPDLRPNFETRTTKPAPFCLTRSRGRWSVCCGDLTNNAACNCYVAGGAILARQIESETRKRATASTFKKKQILFMFSWR